MPTPVPVTFYDPAHLRAGDQVTTCGQRMSVTANLDPSIRELRALPLGADPRAGDQAIAYGQLGPHAQIAPGPGRVAGLRTAFWSGAAMAVTSTPRSPGVPLSRGGHLRLGGLTVGHASPMLYLDVAGQMMLLLPTSADSLDAAGLFDVGHLERSERIATAAALDGGPNAAGNALAQLAPASAASTWTAFLLTHLRLHERDRDTLHALSGDWAGPVDDLRAVVLTLR